MYLRTGVNGVAGLQNTLVGVRFTNNFGYVTFASWDSARSPRFTFIDTVFADNDNGGSPMFALIGFDASFTRCHFLRNRGTATFPYAAFQFWSSATTTFDDCVFEGNDNGEPL